MSAMCPSHGQHGFAAPVAAFVIVLGLVLAGAMALVSSTQQTGSALDIQGARAYQTARAGIEWGIHHVLRAGGLDCAGINGNNFSPGGALAGFSVTVLCTESSHTEAGGAVNMYQITATACSLAAGPCPGPTPGGVGYVERQLRVSVGSN